jgi:hypothetical protein
MGIDVNALNFLSISKNIKPLGQTVTIGRQELMLQERDLIKIIKTESGYKIQNYCEELIEQYLGASKVDSIDYDDYENPTHQVDMNEPLPEDLYGKYDTVIDAGSLEHIFHLPQAFKNCSLLCKPGGQILHMLPANNYCGHGFWQFSPELFFSLYSEKNGYKHTEVFLCDAENISEWYQVTEPIDGQQVNIISSVGIFVMARTFLQNTNFTHKKIHQSIDWSVNKDVSLVNNFQAGITESSNIHSSDTNYLKQVLKKMPFVGPLIKKMYATYLKLTGNSYFGLNSRNPGLTKYIVKSNVHSK